VIVSQFTLDRVKRGVQRKVWLPVEHGMSGEILPCSLEQDEQYSLQPAAFTDGIWVTVDRVERRRFDSLTAADARGIGLRLDAVLAAWRHEHGDTTPDLEVDVVAFTLGAQAAQRREMSERYLNAKLGGARDYTTDPAKAVRGEGAVLEPTELHVLAHEAKDRHHLRGLSPVEDRIAALERDLALLRQQMRESGVASRLLDRKAQRAQKAMREIGSLLGDQAA
jgi:hypothetical protein